MRLLKAKHTPEARDRDNENSFSNQNTAPDHVQSRCSLYSRTVEADYASEDTNADDISCDHEAKWQI